MLMRRKLLVATLLFFPAFLIAQQKLGFTYDSAGNQIVREPLCLNCTQFLEEAAVLKDSVLLQTIKEAGSVMEFSKEEDIRIAAYPNPVTDILQVQWIEHPVFVPHHILLYSRDNRYLDQIILSKNQNTQDISFKRYPSGTYILVVVFENGRRRSFQIIRKS